VRRAVLVLALFLAGPGTASAATQITFLVHPAVPVYNRAATLSGTVTVNGSPPAGQHVDLIADTGTGWAILASTSTHTDGTYSFSRRLTAPGFYAAQTQGATSPAIQVHLRPRLTATLRGLPYPGAALFLAGRMAPRAGGALTLHVGTHAWPVKVKADGTYRARLPTRRPGHRRARLVVTPSGGFEAVVVRRGFTIRTPYLAIGSSGRGVLALERRLRSLNYALRNVNTFYGADTYEAVLAFQKVHRMGRTGRVGDAFWWAFGRATVPHARIDSGSHIEVDKTRQVLFEVRSGKVVRVIHVSTGATGNTPVGHWHVYLKTPGLNSHGMYYSMYWLRGFAVHGYASVPPWPASHGCVRIPMWLAPGLYSHWDVGTSVYVYYS
jgi:hypothetical protein